MRSDYVKRSVFEKIYSVLQYENQLAVRLSVETGARIGDVVALRSENLIKNTIVYNASKTGKRDKKVISKDLAERLRRNASGGYIFPSKTAAAGHRTRQAVWADIKKAVDVLGLKGNISPHSARKTYAVEDYHKNGINQAQKDLQHSRLDTTLLYVLSDQFGSAPPPTQSRGACEKCCFDCDAFTEKVAQALAEKLILLFKDCKKIN